MLVSLIDFRSYFTVTHTITTCTISLELARLLSLSSEQTKSKEKTCEILNQMAQAGEIDSMIVAQVIDNYDLIEGKIWKEAAAVLEKYNTIIVTYSDLLNRKQELIEAKWLYLVFRYSKTGIVNLKID